MIIAKSFNATFNKSRFCTIRHHFVKSVLSEKLTLDEVAISKQNANQSSDTLIYCIIGSHITALTNVRYAFHATLVTNNIQKFHHTSCHPIFQIKLWLLLSKRIKEIPRPAHNEKPDGINQEYIFYRVVHQKEAGNNRCYVLCWHCDGAMGNIFKSFKNMTA